MSRRVLTFVIALAIALVGYQPYLGMTSASAAPMEMSAASDGDCPEMQKMKDDCCDKTQKDKRICVWNDACAARCHVNAGIEAAFIEPPTRLMRATVVAITEPPPLRTARAGPHFRPPIV